MKSLILPAKMENLDQLTDFVSDFSKEAGFEQKIINKIRLAFEEAVVNVINYAYSQEEDESKKFVEIECSTLQDSQTPGISITIIDQGMKFDPLAKNDPNIELPAEERPIGGLGIFMVKQIMDDLNYSWVDGRNMFTLKKYN